MDPFDKSFDIIVDVLIPASSYSYEEVEFSQSDENTSILNISITKKGRNLDVTNATILVAFQKPDNTFVYQDTTNGVTVLDAVNGKVSIELSAQVLSLSGTVNGEILITYPTNKSITSKPFHFLVDASIFTGMGSSGSSPNDVTGLAANNVTSTSLTLSWSVSSGATSYDVYNGSTLLANVATTTYNVNQLVASTSYTFKVIAKNAGGSSSGTGSGATTTVTTTASTAVVGSSTVGSSTVA